MIRFIPRRPGASLENFGYIPMMLNENNPASAKEQLDAGYSRYGGWDKFEGFTMGKDESLRYPGDPPQKPIAELQLRDERIVIYPSSWVAIIQPDGKWEVARMD